MERFKLDDRSKKRPAAMKSDLLDSCRRTNETRRRNRRNDFEVRLKVPSMPPIYLERWGETKPRGGRVLSSNWRL